MVKFLALTAIVLSSALISDVAQARGRHGCASCSMGGCPGGVCAMPAGPGKMATTNGAVAPVAAAPAPAGQPAVANTAPAAPRYFASNTGRGLFGRRR